jgi:hypothetical protein
MSFLLTRHLIMLSAQAWQMRDSSSKILAGWPLKLIEIVWKINWLSIFKRQMHDEVSETENLRKNLAVERMIVEGCDILLDVNQVFVRQGKCAWNMFRLLLYENEKLLWKFF